MKFTKQMSDRLNILLVKAYDAEKEYLNAMNKVEEPEIKMFFKRTAEQRGDFARDLRREILSYGQIPEDSGSFRGDTVKFWTNLKALLSQNKVEVVLEECLKEENRIIEEYNEILEDQRTLPPTTAELLIEHRAAIKRTMNKVKLFEEVAS
ncbi:PA2169 family four-helix-bundle protein [Robertkochia marina]|uniref:PA2169 family four-helix-bundle protein n=1 Tax=Robertkochia marina TaxID=1227945 RepID=A0A4S3M4F2_9FLAO|nr:PA2169 family four-helix-bundle protein [Robertkochia marina]THD69057.1 PA2169 family four-helix-bundle protein [Robertkochia marina]TRZ44881.1 PA2169 family four-helix-bundle protein [Robertkochia marina]